MAIIVEARKMTLAERLYLPAVIKGMLLTLAHLFKKKVTMQYPEVQKILPPGYRGAHRLNKDEQDRIKCVACEMCAVACPADCITSATAWPEASPAPAVIVAVPLPTAVTDPVESTTATVVSPLVHDTTASLMTRPA